MSRPPATVRPYTPTPKPGTPRTVACPRCRVQPGYACRRMTPGPDYGTVLAHHHLERRKAARGE